MQKTIFRHGIVAAFLIVAGCGSSPGGTTGTGGAGGTGTGGATGGVSGTGGTLATGGTAGAGTGGTAGAGTGGTAGAGTGGTAGAGTGGTAGAGTGGSSGTGGTAGAGTGGSAGAGTGGTAGAGTGGTPICRRRWRCHRARRWPSTITARVCRSTPAHRAAAADAGADAGAITYAWVLKAPDAVLTDAGGAVVGTHGAGPEWTSTDGSMVNGMKVLQANAPGTTSAIPWLLLRASSTTGTGSSSNITYIQRVNTVGGVAPATGCGGATSGTQTSVAYMADYYFYTGGGAAAWLAPPGNLPSTIAAPTGNKLAIHDRGIGTQVYTCTQTPGGARCGSGQVRLGAQGAGRRPLQRHLRPGGDARRRPGVDLHRRQRRQREEGRRSTGRPPRLLPGCS